MDAPSVDQVEVAWERDVDAVRTAGIPHGELDRDDFAALARGEPIAKRMDTPDGAFATGAIVMPVPIEAAWLSIQDATHFSDPDEPLKVTRLPGETPLGRDVYMKLELPWPLADRHWVAAMRSNETLHSATDGRVWQRSWSLADPTLAPDPDPKGIWVKANTGSWTLVDLGDHTLAVIAARAVLGGSIPPAISQTWAIRTLADSMQRVSDRAEVMEEHYGEEHAPIYVPDGSVVKLTSL